MNNVCCKCGIVESTNKEYNWYTNASGKTYTYFICIKCYKEENRQKYIKMTSEQKALRRIKTALRSRKLRNDAIKYLGGKCVKCGISELEVLELDHILNDGAYQRDIKKQYSYKMWKQILNGERTDIQVLCANCHRRKTNKFTMKY